MFNPQPKPEKQPKKKAKYIRKLSKKRAAEFRLFHSKTKPEYLADNPNCEKCNGVAVEVHHKKGNLGALLNDTRYFMSVCRDCHDWIERNPKQSKEQGFSISRLKTHQ